jgi:excisionase family DNA binding protein
MLLRPAQLGMLVGLLREGARSVSGRRRLTPAEVALLQEIELYAYDVRSVAGTVGRQQDQRPSGSWLTTEQAARRLHVTPEYVRRLARRGDLVAERHGHAWLIDADSVTTHRSAA